MGRSQGALELFGLLEGHRGDCLLARYGIQVFFHFDGLM